MEEMGALPVVEGHAERLLERLLELGEGRQVRLGLDARERVAGIGREEPGDVLGLGEDGAVEQHTAHESSRRRSRILGRAGGMGAKLPKGFGIARQLDMLEVDRASRLVAPDEKEAPVVGDEHETVALPIALHLLAARELVEVVLGCLDLDDAAVGRGCRSQLVAVRLAAPEAGDRVEAEVRLARTLIGDLPDAQHLRLEVAAGLVEEILQRRVIGGLGRGAVAPDFAHLLEEALEGRGQSPLPMPRRAIDAQGARAGARMQHESARAVATGAPPAKRQGSPCKPTISWTAKRLLRAMQKG